MTAFNFMGALLMMLHKQPPKPGRRDHKVAKAYGAPAPVTIFDEPSRSASASRWSRSTARPSSAPPPATPCTSRKVGSCGVPAPHYEVEIHDEHDNPVAARHRGRDLRQAEASPT